MVNQQPFHHMPGEPIRLLLVSVPIFVGSRVVALAKLSEQPSHAVDLKRRRHEVAMFYQLEKELNSLDSTQRPYAARSFLLPRSRLASWLDEFPVPLLQIEGLGYHATMAKRKPGEVDRVVAEIAAQVGHWLTYCSK